MIRRVVEKIVQVMVFLHAVIASFLMALVSSQVPYLGECPKITPMENFNMSKYMGKWYEAERYFQVFQMGSKCVSAEYVEDGDDKVRTINRQTNPWTFANSKIQGFVIDVKNGQPSSPMTFRYPYSPVDVQYWILRTDYDNYSVAWSCTSFQFVNIRYAWILTRDRYPSIETMERAYEVLDANGISRAYLFRTDQSHCADIWHEDTPAQIIDDAPVNVSKSSR